jgi:hypothetical protein
MNRHHILQLPSSLLVEPKCWYSAHPPSSDFKIILSLLLTLSVLMSSVSNIDEPSLPRECARIEGLGRPEKGEGSNQGTMAQRIYARPKACKLRASTMLDYKRRESASGSHCMHAFLGPDARLPEWEVLWVDTTAHHILGSIMPIYEVKGCACFYYQ